MDSLELQDRLYLQGLEVGSVMERPSSELYSSCILSNPSDIRLLRILPAPRSPAVEDESPHPLVAQLFSGALPDLKGKYESLSYVWGSEQKPRTITILVIKTRNDSNEAMKFECNITENLWMALIDLRQNSEYRDIWTDALCINQTDIPEKEVQVSQMRDVYAGCRRTIAHLGPYFHGLDALIAFRYSYLTRYWFFRWPLALDPRLGGKYMLFHPERGIVRKNQILLPHVMGLLLRGFIFLVLRYALGFFIRPLWAQTIAIIATNWELEFRKFYFEEEEEVLFTPEQVAYGLTEFFTRPWFRRIWIVQEFVVSPKVTFIINRAELDTELDILHVAEMYTAMRDLKVVTADLVTEEMGAFLQLYSMRDSRSTDQSLPSLLTLLSWTWNKGVGQEATNPRDRIFALLGIAHENPAYFVDYNLEVHEVFWRYAQVLIELPEGFMLLEDPRRHQGSTMPSWVPELTQKNQQSIYGPLPFYSCSKGVPFLPYQLQSTGESIEVSAILLAGIDSVGRQYDPIPEGFPRVHRLFNSIHNLDDISIDLVDFIMNNKSINRISIEPRDDIKDMIEKYHVRLPKGLDSEAAVEVLFQIGILMDQTEGSHGAARARQMYQVEKSLDTKHAQDLIAANVTAAFYAILIWKHDLASNTLEDLEEVATEIGLFWEECANDPDLERGKIFQRLMEQPETYPRMCADPLFRALSQDEWPPESMRNDTSIPAEVYNDNAALYYHWRWSVCYIAANRAWAGRRLAKNSQGYLCNAAEDTRVGDRIAIVAGCRMPFILRSMGNGTYKIIGHAYVLGLMYGEVMELGIESRRILIS